MRHLLFDRYKSAEICTVTSPRGDIEKLMLDGAAGVTLLASSHWSYFPRFRFLEVSKYVYWYGIKTYL
jgi:hypothetical protein